MSWSTKQNSNYTRDTKLRECWTLELWDLQVFDLSVGLIVFGGMDPVSKVVVSDTALELAFSKKQNYEVWKKDVTAPLT
eukprot:CCRYP_018619-RA/>CCRYP_018619-RA protein AED:0.55 eAED:0.43 QI:0/0/0/1/0/0/2/0/78